jgi:integrase
VSRERKERWLDAREIAKLEGATPREWWALFAALVYTGLRVAEAQGLEWGGCTAVEQRIRLHERSGRRLKTASSQRDVPVASAARRRSYRTRNAVPSGPADSVFPGSPAIYWNARNNFARAVRSFEIAPATIHDLRHTFAVRCAQAGVPLPPIQKLLGHASPVMTMRYMKHAPEAYFVEDAARIAASIQGTGIGVEQEARAETARASIRLA